MEEEDTEEDAEDGGKKGEGGKPADWIIMDQFEPDEIAYEGNDDRLI